MQVYRELRLLTARPSEGDEARVPHRLYGTYPRRTAYSVGRWLRRCRKRDRRSARGGGLPILVGGTGLYFKALTEGLAPVPDIPAEIRAYWRDRAASARRRRPSSGTAARDPAMAARLGPADPQRIVRALEVIDATRSPWPNGRGQCNAAAGAWRCVEARDRAGARAAYAAIDARFDRMVEEGAMEEVRALLALELDPGLPAMRAHGVRELGGVSLRRR